MSSLPNSFQELEYYRAKCEQYECWLRALDEHARFDVWFKDAESTYQFVNKHFEQSMGMERNKLVGNSPRDIFQGDRAQRVYAMDQKVMNEEWLERTIPCDASGKLAMHEEHRFAVKDGNGQVVGLGCFAFETTEKSLAEEALARAQKIAHLGNWRWSVKENNLVSCSEQFAAILEVSLPEAFHLMHNRLEKLIHTDDLEIVRDTMIKMNDPGFGGYEIEYRIVMKSGAIKYVREIAEPLLGNDGKPVEYAGTLQDITKQKKAELELQQMKNELELRVDERTSQLKVLAETDPLTGLYNRSKFREEIVKGCSGDNVKCPIVLLDVDKFKDINDSFGHSVGDKLLKILAARIQGFPFPGLIASRLGGDEFGLAFLEGRLSKTEILRICEELYEVISQPITIGGLHLQVDSSFGISMLGEDHTDLEEVLKYADIALYSSKQSPDSITLFEPKMAEEVAFNKQLESDLRHSLNQGQIDIAYQPQYTSDGKTLLGVEALARWNHPTYGNIRPDVFIRIAENCGLINDFGNYILAKACQDIKLLMRKVSRPIRLSVNVSAKQFLSGFLVDHVQTILNQQQFLPEHLELEVTETAFVNNMEDVGRQLKALREIGIKVALDDFGTGYSSLNYLRQFEVDRVKLDRSFIKDLSWSKVDQEIIIGIIKLAHNLNLGTIAEGVEDATQRDLLTSFGCKEIQGFYYSRPISLGQLESKLQTRLSA